MLWDRAFHRMHARHLNQLIEDLRDDDPARRYLAAEEIGALGIGAVRALPALINTLRDPDPLVAEMAIEALGKMPLPAALAVEPLTQLIKGDVPSLRRPAARLISRFGRVALPSLIIGLQDPRADVRRTCVIALGWIGPEAARAVESLGKRLVYDQNEEVRQAVLASLSQIGTTEARRLLDEYGSMGE